MAENPGKTPTWYCRKSFGIKKNWSVKFGEAKHHSAMAGSYGNHPLGQAHSKHHPEEHTGWVWSLLKKKKSNNTFLPSPFLLVRMRSSIAPLFIGSFTTWRRKLPSLLFRSLLDCLWSAVLHRYQSAWISPWGPGLVNVRLLLSVYRWLHPHSLPGWVACSRTPL